MYSKNDSADVLGLLRQGPRTQQARGACSRTGTALSFSVREAGVLSAEPLARSIHSAGPVWDFGSITSFLGPLFLSYKCVIVPATLTSASCCGPGSIVMAGTVFGIYKVHQVGYSAPVPPPLPPMREQISASDTFSPNWWEALGPGYEK